MRGAWILYTIRLVTNSRVTALAEPLAPQAPATSAQQDGTKVRLLEESLYQAGSWERPRRVIIKADALVKELKTRFVVTVWSGDPETLSTWYTHQGETGNWIKDLKLACFADRLS